MSLVPEVWALVAREGDTVIVTRVKYEVGQRVTTWRLRQAIVVRDGRPVDDWLVTQVFFSQPNEGLDGEPARLKDYGKGIRLSDNAIDRQLRTLANGLY